MPGKTWESIFFANSSLQRMMPPRRAAKGFVSGGGDEIRVRDWRWMHSGGYQPGDVRHIDKEIGTDFLREFPHPFKVDDA